MGLPVLAGAQDFPSRPVRLIVGFPAGSAPDVVARLVAPLLGDQLGQTVIVDNRPGAGSNIATSAALRSPPDGYTLLLAVATNTVNATLYTNLDYDFPSDIAPVARMISVANVVAVAPSFPAKDAKEFIVYTRANPGKVNMASNGTGSSTHVAGEMYKALAGAELVHVPYSGNYYPDLIAGQVQVAFTPLPGAIAFIRSGQLRALAVTTAQRSEFLPDVPALAEFLPGYDAAGWYGLVAPKNTPGAVVERINRAANAMMASEAMRQRLPELAGAPFVTTPAEFGAFISAETVKWAKVIRAANIRPD